MLMLWWQGVGGTPPVPQAAAYYPVGRPVRRKKVKPTRNETLELFKRIEETLRAYVAGEPEPTIEVEGEPALPETAVEIAVEYATDYTELLDRLADVRSALAEYERARRIRDWKSQMERERAAYEALLDDDDDAAFLGL